MSVPYKPHAYQLDAIKFMVSRATAGLFLDPGLGKTSITYAAFQTLRRKKAVRKMLVIAPLRPAYSVWPGEARKWDEFKDLKVVVLHGKDKAANLASDADVYVINPEGLDWLFRQFRGKRVPFDMLVVDESTRFKHSTTQRFRTLRPWLTYFARRYILTGSPAPNGLLDLFGQVFILDLGNSLGQYITHYRNTFFDASGFNGYEWKPRPGAAEQIQGKLKPLVLRMDASELVGMPPLIGVDPPNIVSVDLPDKVRRMYDQMENLLLADIEKEIVTAANAAVASGKCRQIANGGLFHSDEDGERTWTHLHQAKVEAVEELVEEMQGTPALVAYEFHHDLERLQKAFPNAPYIGGGVPAKKFREIEEAWNCGWIPVLLAQPQSVAHGLNLQGTKGHVIWHSQTFNLEDHEQLIRRIWRQGQKEKVYVHYVCAKDTIDEMIIRTLGRKDKTQRGLLLALKDHLSRKGRRAA